MLLFIMFTLMWDFRKKKHAINKAVIERIIGQPSDGMIIESFVGLFYV